VVFKLSKTLSNSGKMTKKFQQIENLGKMFFSEKVVQFPVCYPSAATLETIFYCSEHR
jgi:hypothetical protein